MAGGPQEVELIRAPPLCPVKHLTDYLKAATPHSGPGGTGVSPVFVLHSGKPIEVDWLNATLKRALTLCDISPERYSSHSLRIGATDTAGMRGATEDQLAGMGRWNTLASVQVYRRDGTTTARAQAARQLLAHQDDEEAQGLPSDSE